MLLNAFTFADPRVSIIVFGFGFMASIVSMMLIALLSMNTYLVMVGASLLLGLASYEFLGEQTAQLSERSKYTKLVSRVSRVVENVRTLFSKVPDELELQHRKIAAAQIVKEGGAEMLDAAASFQE